MNKLIILGRLTENISIKEGANASYTSFTIAYSKGNKNNTLFLDCVAFNEVARNLKLYIRKGARVLLEGELMQDNWVDKSSGEKKSKIRLQVRNFYKIDYEQNDKTTKRIEIDLNDKLPF